MEMIEQALPGPHSRAPSLTRCETLGTSFSFPERYFLHQ